MLIDRHQMGNDLMSIQIEVNPLRRFASQRTTKHTRIKTPSRFEISDGKSEVEAVTIRHAGGFGLKGGAKRSAMNQGKLSLIIDANRQPDDHTRQA